MSCIYRYRYDRCLEETAFYFISQVRSDFHMTDSLWLAVHSFATRVLKIALVHQSEDFIKKSKERRITVASNSIDNIKTSKTTTKTRRQKWDEMGWKTTVWIFQATKCRNLTQESLNITTKGNFQRKTKSRQIAQNNDKRSNYIKYINNTEQNSNYWLGGNKDEMINYIDKRTEQPGAKGVQH